MTRMSSNLKVDRSWDHHGRLLPRKNPELAPKQPTPFLFDGVKMTGFLDEPTSKSDARYSEHKIAQLSPIRRRQEPFHYQNGGARRTYLDGINKFSSSPGPSYDTSNHRHNPGPSSPQYSWHLDHSASVRSQRRAEAASHSILKPATPSQTSKFARTSMVDWSTSNVSRNRAASVAAGQRPIRSRSGLRERKSGTVATSNTFDRGASWKRPQLPWGNPMVKMKAKPAVLPYYVRFHKHDDRCSSLGGNYFEEHMHHSQESEDFCAAVTEIEAHIQLRRQNIWKTLRPTGLDLLNFPKLFYEK